MKSKSKFLLIAVMTFMLMLVTASPLFLPAQIVQAKEDDTYTIAGSELDGFYSYKDRDSNTIVDCYTEFGGISVHYSGGNDNMLSGLYNSVDAYKKHLLFNKGTSTLTFTSGAPVKNVRFLFFNLPQDNNAGAIDVNHGKWTNEIYIAAYDGYYVGNNWVETKIYALEMSGPASLNVAMQSHYQTLTWKIEDIVEIMFTFADSYQYETEEGIYCNYDPDGGLIFNSTDPFWIKNSTDVIAFATKSGNEYTCSIVPTEKVYAEKVTNSVTVSKPEAFSMAANADYITKIILGGNITITGGFTANRSLEIDLNGHTLAMSSSATNKGITVGTNCTLTISDSGENGTLTGFDNINVSDLDRKGRFCPTPILR